MHLKLEFWAREWNFTQGAKTSAITQCVATMGISYRRGIVNIAVKRPEGRCHSALFLIHCLALVSVCDAAYLGNGFWFQENVQIAQQYDSTRCSRSITNITGSMCRRFVSHSSNISTSMWNCSIWLKCNAVLYSVDPCFLINHQHYI